MPKRKENKDYGKIIDYDPLWKGPLEIEREQTDFGFLIGFIVYTIIWICTGIYAFTTGVLEKGTDAVHHEARTSMEVHHVAGDATAKTIAYIGFSALALSIMLCFLYIFLMRHYPKTVVYTAIVVTLILMFLTICFFAYLLAQGGQNSKGAIGGLVGSVFGFVIIVVVLILYRRNIIIACGVIKEATKAVWFFPSSFLFPMLPMIFYGLSLAFAAATGLYLSQHPSIKANHDKTPVQIYLLHGINIFGWLWMTNFIHAFSQMVLSGSFATWFWTMDKDRVPNYTILRFIGITTRFHLGSLAFGSLILAIIQAIKMLCKAASNKARENGDGCGALIMSCLSQLFKVIEDLIDFLNTNAYIMCTVHGTAFVRSAKDAFNLLMRNVMNVLIISNVTDAIMFLGSLIVIGVSMLSTYLYCKDMADILQLALIVVFIVTFVVSAAIFEVLKTAINTIFLCVLEDYERNDGSSERPYFMPYKLRELLINDEQ